MNSILQNVTVHKNGVLYGSFPMSSGTTRAAFRTKSLVPTPLEKARLLTVPLHALPPGTTIATWAELHRYKPSPHLTENRAWMAHFMNRLPPGPCDCRPHWIALLNLIPPDFTTLEKWFEWSVEAHNRVNVKIGKTVMSIADAKRVWIV